MAILRAPSQFSPATAGGPVTPSCCGCSCCCCCVGSAVAISVALPMVLHQITRPRPATLRPELTTVAADSGSADGARVGPGRRIAGIALAALTVPASVAVGIVMQQLGGLGLISAVVVAIVLGVGSYLLAGSNAVGSMATPLLIMLIGTLMAFGELFLWIVILIDDDASKAAKTFAGLAVLAIPVITTVLLVITGRRARTRSARG